jgi:hypothetical protein
LTAGGSGFAATPPSRCNAGVESVPRMRALLALALLFAFPGCCRAASSCKVLADTDLAGHDLSSGHTTSFETCCSLCDGTEGCSFWTWMPPQTCYMKTSSAGHRPSPRGGVHSYTSGCVNQSCVLPPPAPPAPHGGGGKTYGCDPHGGERGVCVNGGVGNFPNSSCGAGCANFSASFRCQSDWDCSLAGTCEAGTCKCDAWASGSDCSYLNFQPVDKKAFGYIDETWSSWG